MNEAEISDIYESVETESEKKQRTARQNRAMWKAHEEVAREMEMQGLMMKALIDALKVGVRPTKEGVHEVFKACMTAMYPGVESTTDLSTTQLQKLWTAWSEDVLKERLNIFVEWPSDEPPL